MFTSFRPDLKNKARKLRSNTTKPEQILWHSVLSRKQTGYRFLRQKPINQYIVDFYCSSKKIIIEVDGDSHSFQEKYDEERTHHFELLGISVIRISNREIVNNLEGVKEYLYSVLNN